MTETALQTSNAAPAVVAATATYERLTTVRGVLAPDLNDQELQLFALVAQRSGLDPFARQVFAIKRAGRVSFQTGIEGYRSTAERTGEYDGSDEPVFGEMVNGHPESASVTVYRWRNGRRVGQTATAYWAEFYPGDQQGAMWKKMPRNQLAKCAEALALRKAFPYVLADLYTSEEMDAAGPAENAELAKAAAQPTAAERIAARRAAIEAAEVVEGEVTEVPPEVAPVPQPTEEPAAAPAGGCGWSLQPKGSDALIPCTFGQMHSGEHSFTEQAVKSGGRVVPPAE